MGYMEPTVATTGLDDLLDQLSESLTPEMAQLLVDFRANTQTIERMDLLAEKSNDGTLTEAEQREYAEAARAGTLIAILQAKAKKVLRDKSA
jgi:hypothetical protein